MWIWVCRFLFILLNWLILSSISNRFGGWASDVPGVWVPDSSDLWVNLSQVSFSWFARSLTCWARVWTSCTVVVILLWWLLQLVVTSVILLNIVPLVSLAFFWHYWLFSIVNVFAVKSVVFYNIFHRVFGSMSSRISSIKSLFWR